jgi:DNA primase
MIEKKEVMERLDMREYYAQFFPRVNGERTEISVCSPFREDRHPSFSVNITTGLWYDHATGEGGDVFDFEQRRTGCDFKAALGSLARRVGMNNTFHDKESCVKKDESVGHKDDAVRWNAALFESAGLAARTFLIARGLTDETLRQYLIGYDDKLQAITVPLFFQDNQIVSLKRMFFYGHGWRMRNGKKDFRNYSPATLYCAELVKHVESVIVCEGEFDCLLLRQNGFDTITGTSGAGTWKSSWSENLRGKDVVLIFDSDDVGRKGVLKVAEKLEGIARTIRIADLFPENNGSDKDRKDVTDFFRLGGTVEEFKSVLSDSKEFKNEVALSEEETAPRFSQARIADEILEEHDSIFVGGSFYTYGNGIWRKDGKRFIEREIKKRCGTKATRNLIGCYSTSAMEC